ncbi:MAG TPA: flagellar motor switch protein FliN [Mycobacteriales bacterium]|nr:flagellar motor switch protein FliN [Mycobacteriales bacterium]
MTLDAVDLPRPRTESPDLSAGLPTPVEPAELPDLETTTVAAAPGEARDVGLLADVRVEVTVELGRATLPLRSLLSMTPGSVLELDRTADALVDVLVNGRLVARGEVVVVDGEIGVRISSLVAEQA